MADTSESHEESVTEGTESGSPVHPVYLDPPTCLHLEPDCYRKPTSRYTRWIVVWPNSLPEHNTGHEDHNDMYKTMITFYLDPRKTVVVEGRIVTTGADVYNN